MKCLNAQKKVTRFVRTYINYLVPFQINCLRYVNKHFPEPTDIKLDDDYTTVQIKWENSIVYIMNYKGLSYEIVNRYTGSKLGGGLTYSNINDAQTILRHIKPIIKP